MPPICVKYGLKVQQRKLASPAVPFFPVSSFDRQKLVLKLPRAFQMFQPLVQGLVEADHHRRRRLQTGLNDRPLRLESTERPCT